MQRQGDEAGGLTRTSVQLVPEDGREVRRRAVRTVGLRLGPIGPAGEGGKCRPIAYGLDELHALMQKLLADYKGRRPDHVVAPVLHFTNPEDVVTNG